MKSRRHPSLFELPDAYLIDTSAWLQIDERADSEDVWRLIVDLIKQGRIFVCAQIINEIRNDPVYDIRLKRYEKALRAGDHGSDDISYLQRVGQITHDYPAMSKATGAKTPADPYVVALAEIEGYIVVTHENCKKRPNRKIPGVCKQLGILCLTLDEFIALAQAESDQRRK